MKSLFHEEEYPSRAQCRKGRREQLGARAAQYVDDDDSDGGMT